jgi:hypothetical protein
MPDMRYEISNDAKLVTFRATSPKGQHWMGDDQRSMILEQAVTYRDTARASGLEVYAEVPRSD